MSRTRCCHNIETISQRDQKKICRKETRVNRLPGTPSMPHLKSARITPTTDAAWVEATTSTNRSTPNSNPLRIITKKQLRIQHGETRKTVHCKTTTHRQTSFVTRARLQPGHSTINLREGFSPCKPPMNQPSVVHPESIRARVYSCRNRTQKVRASAPEQIAVRPIHT